MYDYIKVPASVVFNHIFESTTKDIMYHDSALFIDSLQSSPLQSSKYHQTTTVV